MFLSLYKALIRPHLEYASTVWSVIYKKDCISIENVQRRATRLLHGLKGLNYTQRMKELGLPSLQYRRSRADMVEVFKIIKNIDKCDKNKLFTIQQSVRTRGHNQKIFKKQYRLELRKHFFSQRVINDWNNLPDELVNSDTVNQFKSRLNNFWKDRAIKFEPDCYTYPLAHARYQLYERRPERAQESRDYSRPRIQ